MNHWGENEFTWQMTILTVLVIAAIVIVLIWLVTRGKRENRKSGITELPAVLIAVEPSVSGNAMAGRMSRNMDLGISHSRNKMTFQFENGDTIELAGSDGIVDQTMTGKKGILKYQGSKLISFSVPAEIKK